ncbi:MAG: inosine/xanthosine triphosphatase [bacterium]|nr:inosine/xanthosine triphosphatase [bacterium]
MKIKIGSENKSKVEAVVEILRDYPHLASAEVIGVKAESGVADQPKSLGEIVMGAQNRAKSVFSDCDYSIGLESGLMAVPGTKSGYMDVTVCAIYDGQEFHLGLSPAWEFPSSMKEINKFMLVDGLDMAQAINKHGLTNNPAIGSEEGAIGILTKGRLTRKDYTKQALRTALIHLDN